MILERAHIELLMPERLSMLMVDRVVDYRGHQERSLSGEWFVSSDEPALAGHFGETRIWPGVYTIEGLRQSCVICDALGRLDRAGLLARFLATRPPGAGENARGELSRSMLDALAGDSSSSGPRASIQVKLLVPVLPECTVRYDVRQEHVARDRWAVRATVGDRMAAKGVLECPRSAD